MSTLETVVQILAATALLAGGLLAVTGGLGLLLLPNVADRLHAATKPQVLGLLLVCAGTAPFVPNRQAFALGLVVLFQLTTAPVVAQVLGRAAYRHGTGRSALVLDELSERKPEEGAGGR